MAIIPSGLKVFIFEDFFLKGETKTRLSGSLCQTCSIQVSGSRISLRVKNGCGSGVGGRMAEKWGGWRRRVEGEGVIAGGVVGSSYASTLIFQKASHL